MGTDRAGGDSTPRAGDGAPYRKTPTQLATDPAFTTTYAPLSTFKEDIANFNIKAGSEMFGALTTGQFLTGVGVGSLKFNTTGNNNSAFGFHAMEFNQTGGNCTAIGYQALVRQISGDYNTALGHQALAFADGSTENTFVGSQAGYNLLTGAQNVAVGRYSLQGATSINGNVAVGYQAANSVTAGVSVYVGHQAGYQPNNNSANASTTGSHQTCLGYQSGQGVATALGDITVVGYRAIAGGANATAIGSGANAGAAGSIAIGKDSAGTSATTSTSNEAVIGTSLTSLKVGDPGGGQGAWMLGKYLAATVALDTAHYVDVKIDGARYKLAVVA